MDESRTASADDIPSIDRRPPFRDRIHAMWPTARGGLQLLGLLATNHESLHAVSIGIQALVITGDLAVRALTGRRR